MTSSEETALAPGALELLATRVGSFFAGEADGDGDRPQVALVCAKFNGGITQRLVEGALEGLADHGVKPGAVAMAWVPGAFELPVAAQRFAAAGGADAVVALGAVVRGDTPHFEYVAGQCASGLQRVALETGVPVAFGVLTTETVEQAMVRSGPGPDNKGYEAVVTALEMVDVLGRMPGPGVGRPRQGS